MTKTAAGCALKTFVNFTGKQLYWSRFLKKLQDQEHLF